jgi:hypothetical protein
LRLFNKKWGIPHGGLLSSLHMVSASSSPWPLAARAPF